MFECTFRALEWQAFYFWIAGSSSLNDLVYLLDYVYSLQFLTDSFHIRHESPLGGSALVLWSDDHMAIFGDSATINIFPYKMVFYIETQHFNCDVTMLLLWIRHCECMCEIQGLEDHCQPIRIEGSNSQTCLS